MDHIDEHLASACIDDKYDPAIRAAVAIGKKTLNRYYDRTDHLELYRIVMSKFSIIIHVFIFLANFWPLYSLTPPPQALLLPAGWLGSSVDHGSKRYRL